MLIIDNTNANHGPRSWP